MKSSSLARSWATFRGGLLAIGAGGTLLAAYPVTQVPRAQPWSNAILGTVGVVALYALVTTVWARRPLRSSVLATLLTTDVIAMALTALVARDRMGPAALATFGLVTLSSYVSNATVGVACGLIASALLSFTALSSRDTGAPLVLALKTLPLLALYLLGGIAGARLRGDAEEGPSTHPGESRDRAIQDAQRTSRSLSREKEERERQLYDKQRKLYALMSVSHLMSSSRNSTELLQVMCAKAREEMNCAAAFVMLVDGESIRLVQSVGISELTKRVMDGQVGEGLLGEAVANRQIIRLGERDADPRLRSFRQHWEVFRNMLAVPLTTPHDAMPIGLLGVVNLLVGDAFQDDQEDYLKIIAASGAIALRNISLAEELEQSYHEIIHALAQAIEAKDPYTHGHIGRVQEYAVRLARALQLPEPEVKIIAKGAILHDVGKISTPNEILNKAGALTPAERKKMDEHVTASVHILKDIKSLPPEVFEMVLYHHERYDGKGYPFGLKGSEIPVGAQIISVVDAFDAMTSDRPYRKGFPQEKALELLASAAGSQFDPKVLRAFFGLFEAAPRASSGIERLEARGS